MGSWNDKSSIHIYQVSRKKIGVSSTIEQKYHLFNLQTEICMCEGNATIMDLYGVNSSKKSLLEFKNLETIFLK